MLRKFSLKVCVAGILVKPRDKFPTKLVVYVVHHCTYVGAFQNFLLTQDFTYFWGVTLWDFLFL